MPESDIQWDDFMALLGKGAGDLEQCSNVGGRWRYYACNIEFTLCGRFLTSCRAHHRP